MMTTNERLHPVDEARGDSLLDIFSLTLRIGVAACSELKSFP